LNDDSNDANDDLERDAKFLIDNDYLHTSQEGIPVDVARRLVQSAEELYQDVDSSSPSRGKSGIRVLPQQGHLCVFYNLQADGDADPLSFHGGEALLQQHDEEKVVLSFFKEIPLDAFSNKKEFGERAAEIRQSLLDRYYSREEAMRR
jgi:hypothetical protein